MVTPTGRTNELTSSEIPNFCSTVFRVTGKVAALLLVVKANSCTGYMARMNCSCRWATCSWFTSLPGCTSSPIARPMRIATTVVQIYVPMVFPPIRENLLMSFSPVIPFIRDIKTRGMAISWRRRMKICPQGCIQWRMNVSPPSTCKAMRPMIIPVIIPIRICRYRGISDIFCLRVIRKALFYY